MKKEARTPGPWMVNPANPLEVCPQLRPGVVHPCLVTRVAGFSYRNKADAILIAEAPAMLEALRKAVAWLDRLPVGAACRANPGDANLDDFRAILARIDGEA
ncbi:hypothetical protein [Sphingobium sp. HDIP04]|uniref:hypothetical protein n=1 Tax=Sphingobium sp. HDIP04 TaxID=428994 RepID=UPI001268130E|nr:hypothetical protein [Sphingobium sp. HDIP04]